MDTRVNMTLLKFIFFACVFVIFGSSSFASVNSLSGIDIRPNETGSYDIMLKLDKFTRITKADSAKNNLTLIINSAVPSDYVEIVYDNANNLDNIIVQKKNKENTIILLEGKNIENSQILAKELESGVVKEINTNSSNPLLPADKKYTISGIFALFLCLMLLKRKNKSKITENKANALSKNKTAIPQRTIPSINYRVKTSYKSVKMSVPKDFVINKYNKTADEKIRKAG